MRLSGMDKRDESQLSGVCNSALYILAFVVCDFYLITKDLSLNTGTN